MVLSPEARALWETALALNREAAAVSPHVAALPPLIFVTDPERTPEPWRIAARLPAGAGVIYRAFGADDRLETARRLREATAQAGVRLLIGLDAELAAAVEADGVHLPGRMLDQAPALRAAWPDWLLTGAVHGAEDLERTEGLSAAIVSPVFPAGGASASKPALGIEAFGGFAQLIRTPVYALGGINAGNAVGLIGSGACGIAAVGAIVEASGP